MLRSRDLEELEAWLVERALEHDAPKVLFRLARERLRTERLVFPAPDRIVRLVSSARGRAQERTYALVEPLLRWIENPDYRRRIHRQLNKGEALHALRRFLFFAHQGKVQRRQADQQTNQVLCLNLVTNAIVTWNTAYMNAAIERLRAEGRGGSAATSISAICRLPSTGTSIPTVSTDSRSRVERQVSDPEGVRETTRSVRFCSVTVGTPCSTD